MAKKKTGGIVCFIIKTFYLGKPLNWSGKEWSELPAKVYFSYLEATDAIANYWYGAYNLDTFDDRNITIKPLTDQQLTEFLATKKARL